MDSYDSSEEEYSSNNELSCVESDDENQMIGGFFRQPNIKDIDDLDYNEMLDKLKSNIYTTYGDYSFIANPTDFIFYKILEKEYKKEYNRIRDNARRDNARIDNILLTNRQIYITSLGKDYIRQLYYKNNKNLKSYAIKKDLHDIIRKINIFEQKYLYPMKDIIDRANKQFYTNDSQQQQQQQPQPQSEVTIVGAVRSTITARRAFNRQQTLQQNPSPYQIEEEKN